MMMNEKARIVTVTEEDLAKAAGGYVTINNAGCYELYDDNGKKHGTFRGDQWELLRIRAKELGISDEVQMPT